MKKIKYLIPAVALMFGLASCENMDVLYKDYKVDYSIYSTPVSNVKALPGYERAMLSWDAPKDKIAKGIKITWNNDENELVIDSLPNQCYVEDLAAGSYEFKVYTYDSWGNVSLPRIVNGTVYGENDAKNIARPSVSITINKETNTHVLKFANVSGAMSNWGGKMEFTLTGPDGVTSELNTSLNQEINPLERKKFEWTSANKKLSMTGYYSRAIDLTVDLGVLPAGEYTIDYNASAFPAVFNNKAVGYITYTAICVDALEFSDSVTVNVEAIEIPEPEAPAEGEETEETPAE